LFLPFTRLLVLGVDKPENGRWTIKLRELELGLTRGQPLLWVDDLIHSEQYENKRLMEEALKKAGREIKYILKPSTDLALSFLRSWMGKLSMGNPNFRVLSDMSRPKELDGDNAGARLVALVRAVSQKVPVLVFTSNAVTGAEKILAQNKELQVITLNVGDQVDLATKAVLITMHHAPALEFCTLPIKKLRT